MYGLFFKNICLPDSFYDDCMYCRLVVEPSVWRAGHGRLWRSWSTWKRSK